MASMAFRYSDPSDARRSGSRYPIVAELHYRMTRKHAEVETGRGCTVNISSSGILIETDHALPAGLRVELSIAWPVRLNNVTPLQLCVKARTIRTEGRRTALKIFRHEFRTRPPLRAVRAEAGPVRQSLPDITRLQTRLNASVEEVSRMAGGRLDGDARAVLRGVVEDYRTKLNRLAVTLPR
jgi:hypothetical protein